MCRRRTLERAAPGPRRHEPLHRCSRTEKEGADGMMVAAVRPYLMDLGATNGTSINGERLEPQRYYELLEQDVIKTGNSSREYVLLHDKSGGR